MKYFSVNYKQRRLIKIFSNLWVIFFICSVFPVFAANVETKNAETAAINFYNFVKYHNNKSIPINSNDILETFTISDSIEPLYYIFNFVDTGFVMVSADDNAYPILGFSDKNIYKENNQPPVFMEWMEHYKKQIIYVKKSKMEQPTDIQDAWNGLLSNNLVLLHPGKGTSVNPLLFSQWDQTQYFNDQCPAISNGPGGHALTGCVATAMGQIMNYYKYPSQGIGIGRYYWLNPSNVYVRLTVNFGTTTYDWANMTDIVLSSNPAVALLLYHVGIAVQMQYGADGSSASISNAIPAFVNHFGYSTDATYYDRSTMDDVTWANLLKSNLDNKVPVLYGGFPLSVDSSGHSFVCDGYNASTGTNYFHFNWGWSGYLDGYFNINNLNPGGLDFSYNENAIVNIYPPKNSSSYPAFCSGLKTLTSSMGSIYNNSGPFTNYENNSDCSWLINPSATNQNIILEFDEFNTEPNNDVVTVYNGSTTSDSILGVFSGSTIPPKIISEGNMMLITFTSNDSITASGFLANYYLSSPVKSTGIENVTSSTKLMVFPNPADDNLNISLTQSNEIAKMKINLFSITGALIYSEEIENINSGEFLKQIDISRLPQGLYSLRLEETLSLQNQLISKDIRFIKD